MAVREGYHSVLLQNSSSKTAAHPEEYPVRHGNFRLGPSLSGGRIIILKTAVTHGDLTQSPGPKWFEKISTDRYGYACDFFKTFLLQDLMQVHPFYQWVENPAPHSSPLPKT